MTTTQKFPLQDTVTAYQLKMAEFRAAEAEAAQADQDIVEATRRRDEALERSRLAQKDIDDCMKCVKRASLDLLNLASQHKK